MFYVWGESNMKNNSSGKILMLGIVSIFVLASFVPVVSSSIQKQEEKGKTIIINVLDSGSRYLTEHYVSEGNARKIIALMEEEISQESFTKQIEERLNVLNDIGIISSETANNLANKFKTQQKFLDKNRLIPTRESFFDVFNLFSGVFFGLKGTKDYTFLELNIYEFPFFNSTILAQFSVLSKFTGSGCIFTLGTLGFRYIYEFDQAKYEFPHLPDIGGSVIGFTGVLLEFEVGDALGEEYEGSYVVGIGMNIASIWNNLE